MEPQKPYPLNPNMHIPDWLHIFLMTFSIFNLSLSAFTFVFQLSHPKSRRNMGRFFLLVLFLQTIDKTCLFLQEILFQNLSDVFYEIKFGIFPRSWQTKCCSYFGAVHNCVGFLSQFYCLWLAVLIKQILKDPIHRLNRFIIFYHALTILICIGLTFQLSRHNHFGVEETLQCGIMNQPQLTEEMIMLLPFLLVPIQIFLIVKIMSQTPHIVRVSLRRFVAKYIIYLFFLIAQQGMQVALIIYGSRKENYYNFNEEDGYKRLRFSYLIMDKITFLCLTTCTLCERVFFDKCISIYKALCVKQVQKNIKRRRKNKSKDKQKKGDENSIEFELLSNPMGSSNNSVISSLDEDDDDFEGGDNCKMEKKDEFDVEDQEKFEIIMKEVEEPNGMEDGKMMSIQQKTNFFIINSVLASICNCILSTKKEESHNVVGMVTGLVKFAKKVITYQLQDSDIEHILDMAQFYKNYPDLCANDVTNGRRVFVKITEYGPDMLKIIRRQSGYSDEYLTQSFSPKENYIEMTKFQEGSGKSASFFFFTANKQFVIKTLKDTELELLVRKGLLEKYFNYLYKNPKSVLARFYGIYTVKVKFMRPINIIVMDNLMGEDLDKALRIYDLKGSTFQRINNNPQSKLSVRKDLNFLGDLDYRMSIDEGLQKDLLQRMQKDKEFLKSCNLMDYSLLIIFFENDTDEADDSHDHSHSRNSYKSLCIKKDDNQVVLELREQRVSRDFDQDVKPKFTDNSRNSIEFDKVIQNGDRTPKQTVPTFKHQNTNQFSQLHSHQTFITGQHGSGSNTNKRNILQVIAKPILHTVGVEEVPKVFIPRSKEFIQYRSSQNRRQFYRLGIIDFLQNYNRRKKLETKWLIFKNRNVSPDTFSCVDPKTYADRFFSFMKVNLFKTDFKISVLD